MLGLLALAWRLWRVSGGSESGESDESGESLSHAQAQALLQTMPRDGLSDTSEESTELLAFSASTSVLPNTDSAAISEDDDGTVFAVRAPEAKEAETERFSPDAHNPGRRS